MNTILTGLGLFLATVWIAQVVFVWMHYRHTPKTPDSTETTI